MEDIPRLDFYVYVHLRSDDGVPFYVGKGALNRAWKTNGRSVYWNRIVAKHGLTVEILKSGLSEDQAFELEKSTIFTLGRSFLCNHTDGGEGLSGYVATDETRRLLSLAGTGRTHSASSKAKMGVSFRKTVYCSNGMTFDGAVNAVNWLKTNGHHFARQSHISRCATNMRKSAYGFSWSYDGVPEYDPELIDTDRRIKQSAAKKGKVAKNIRAVIRSDGMKFLSIKMAADYIACLSGQKSTNSAIVGCCRGKRKTAYGYSWKYETS